MAISFDLIPSTLRVPGAYGEFDSSRAMSGLPLMPYRALIIGQMLDSSEADELVPVLTTNAETAASLFGAGSMLAQMAGAWLENNSFTELYCLPVADDGAAQAAAGSIAFTGAATASGTVCVYVGGTRVRAAVAVGDAAADVAAAVAAAVNAVTGLPVTAGADTGTVTLTAKNAGLAGNDIDVRLNYYAGESLPAGITAAITAMGGGTANPGLADAIAAMGDIPYHIVALPYTDAANLTAMENELEDRWGPLRQIDGLAVAAARGTLSDLSTLGDSRNSEFVSIMDCHKSPSSPWQWAAAVAAVAAYHGNIDPARPFQTLELTGILAEPEAERFTMQERNILLYDGISTHTVASDGAVRIERMITTYKTSPAGADDTAYLDVNTPLTLGYLRYSFNNRMLAKFPRHKLADDGTRYGRGQKVVTPKVAKAEIVALFGDWEEAGLVEGATQFKADLIVERNGSDPNRLDVLLPPDLVNQFRILAAQFQFRLAS